MKKVLAGAIALLALVSCAPPPPPPPPDPLVGIAQALRDAGYTQLPDGTWVPPTPSSTTTTTTTTTTQPREQGPGERVYGGDPIPPNIQLMLDRVPTWFTGGFFYTYFSQPTRDGAIGTIATNPNSVFLWRNAFRSQDYLMSASAHEQGHLQWVHMGQAKRESALILLAGRTTVRAEEAFADCWSQARTPRAAGQGYWDCPNDLRETLGAM